MNQLIDLLKNGHHAIDLQNKPKSGSWTSMSNGMWVSSGLSQAYKHTHFTKLIMHRANYTAAMA